MKPWKGGTRSHKLGKDILTHKMGKVLESILTNNKRTSKKQWVKQDNRKKSKRLKV